MISNKVNFKIKVGEGLDVIDSGIVIGNPGERISFTIDKSSKFYVHFEFGEEGYWGRSAPVLQASPIDDNSALLQFTQYSNSQGEGNSEPIEIGSYMARKLYLNYRIYSGHTGRVASTPSNKGGVTLMYTWMLGDKII